MPERRLIVLRAAAGPDVGFGHLMRTVAFAQGVHERGGEAVVLMTDNPVSDRDLDALRRGVRIERLPAASLEEDAELTAAAIEPLQPSVLVTDVCTLPALDALPQLDAFHRRLKRAAPVLVVFSAGRHLDPSADLVVNPYVNPHGSAAGANGSRVLWGPEYFVFRPEFIRVASQPRMIVPVARRVVVAVGGSDPAGLTPRIVASLSAASADLEVRIVAGPGFTAAQRTAIRASLEARPGWTMIDHPEDMAALFAWADLAVTGDGLTKYETAVTGTPSVIVARADSHPQINAEFVQGGSTVCVEPGPDGTWPALGPTLVRLLDDRAAREELSRRGRALVDGRGLERVLARIPGV